MTSHQQHQALIGAADFTSGLAGEARRLQEDLAVEMKSVRVSSSPISGRSSAPTITRSRPAGSRRTWPSR